MPDASFGVEESQRTFAAALLDPALPVPMQVAARPDAERRFAIHRNNVVSSLIDAIADTFPVVQWLVGEAFFRAMASVYVRGDPPRSRVLSEYGERFPAFVETFEPASSVPYLAAVARLEFARVGSLHAADIEPLEAPDEVIASYGTADVGGLRVRLHPSVFGESATSAAWSICLAYASGRDLADVDVGSAESWLVFRTGLVVESWHVEPATVSFVQALMTGRRLGDAVVAARRTDVAFDVAATVGHLARQRLIVAIERR